ncbi:unnamed protein product [Euphydryas editha]|uniref:Uncharacterized protein n=1 Tax=Euphydryas editha TaxID=104508 RepID=A0AAU9UI31_EUPED|nr:unnamed protein product [Euphydryas editha]
MDIPTGNYTTASNINFVEVIKQDLKRNNDDYKEITQDSKNRVDVITGKKKKRGYRRNADNEYQDYDYEETTFKSHTNDTQAVSVTNTLQKIFILRNQSRTDMNNKIIITKRNSSFTPSMKDLRMKKYQPIGIPKFVKKNKIQNFKQFMKKNEGLFKNFVSNKIAAQTQKTTNVLRQFLNSKDNEELRKPKHLGKTVKKIQRTENKNDGELPSPELLDMAPAKGGRIHKLRERGRLCHRHVLMPEGPKYDSRGRWYLPAHELVAARPYPATRAPRLLLPRCCNCCKKSALGCE